MEKAEIERQREMKVVKSNEMIRKGRFNLSVVEQRIILYMITKIMPGDTGIKTVRFDIREFCEVCGIAYQQNLSQLKQNIQMLADKSMWVKLPNGKQTLIRWIAKPTITEDEGAGVLEIRLDEDLTPYLINLANNFTEYQLISVLAMKSKYSVKLYELLKSYCFLGEYSTSLEDIREYLQVGTKYPESKYFNKYVLDKAIDEINRFTDIEASYTTERTGRTISRYRFRIMAQETCDFVMARAVLAKRLPSRHKQEQEFKAFIQQYDPMKDQMSIFDEEGRTDE